MGLICENGAVGMRMSGPMIFAFLPCRGPGVISLTFFWKVHDVLILMSRRFRLVRVSLFRFADLSTIPLIRCPFDVKRSVGLDLIADLELEGKIDLGTQPWHFYVLRR